MEWREYCFPNLKVLVMYVVQYSAWGVCKDLLSVLDTTANQKVFISSAGSSMRALEA